MAPDWQQGRQAGRPGASRGRSVVWPRQSAAHNWPVTSTQQNFIHARAGQESTRPLRNIQIFTRFSLLVTKTDKKAYSRLFTNSIWDIMKAEVGWLGGWGLWGQSSHSSPEGPKAGPPPQAPGSRLRKALDSLLLGKGLNSSCGGTSFCCLWARKGKSENISI